MINLISPINQLGYGIAGLNIFKSLSELTNVGLWVIGQADIVDQNSYNSVINGIKSAQMWDNDAPCIKIWHQHDMAQFVGRGKRIGFPFFELDEFNEIEKHSLNSLDAIFVTCEWAKEVVVANTSIKEVSVIPLGVDRKIFSDKSAKVNEEKTIFFNCGKWEVRKGHDVLVEIFNNAFSHNDNVELWMMCDNPFLNQEQQNSWRNLYKNSNLGNKIKILPRVKTPEEVYNIMTQVDCGVFPSRAEGWNLELLELMSCGKQVITTNYSAHKAFCNPENSFLVDIESTELAYDGKWFNGVTGSWAKLGIDQKDSFINHMRYVHQNKSINYSGPQTAKKLSWNNTSRSIITHV